MKTIILDYPTQFVNDSIVNTIRIITEYKLDRKQYDGYNRIWQQLHYIDFSSESAGESETRLCMKAGKIGAKVSPEEADQLMDHFVASLKSILSKEVAVSAEVLNIDPHKPVDSGYALLDLIKLIVAGIAIAYGMYALFM